MNDKTNYHHGDLKTALLDAGDEVLSEQGLRGFTLRECARRAGVSHAAPKHHFGGVEGFLTAIAVRGFDRLTDSLSRKIARAGSLSEEFEATTRAYLAFAEKFPEHFRIMFRSDLLDADDPDLHGAAHETFVVLTNVILRQRGDEEIVELGESKNFEDIIADIAIGWCHIHGFAHLVLEQQFSMFTPKQRSELIETSARRLSALLQQSNPF